MKTGLLVILVLTLLVAGCAGQGMSAESIIANTAAAMADCTKAPDAQKDNCFMFISDVLRTVNVTASFMRRARAFPVLQTPKKTRDKTACRAYWMPRTIPTPRWRFAA